LITKDQKDNLFSLVKSLTKSEKRQFKLYVGRLGVNSDSKFLKLFNLLDKAKAYNEASILKTNIVKKQQLANVKAHLYKQILISLRLNPSHQNIRSQIREQLDFASILYHKGLYKQSLKILDKAKELAIVNEEKNMAFEIVELEKIIEAQYITRSMSTRADELAMQAKELSAQNVIASKLSNLSLQLYSTILKTGYVKNEEESHMVTKYFNDRLPEINLKKIGFREKLWLYKANLWQSFLLQDFLNCYKYASKWVGLFHQNPSMINLNPVFYLKGNNYLLESIYFIRNKPKFVKKLDHFKATVNNIKFNKDENVSTLIFLYTNFHSINQYFIDGSFEEGLELIPKIEKELIEFNDRIDQHHKMIFYYKFASLHFGAGNNKACIKYLDKIISNKSLSMREDLLCFSRVLNLVAHYEAGLDYHLETLLRSTYKFLIKMNDLHEVQKEMIKFIRGLQDIYPHDLKKAFKNLVETLKTYEDHPFERRAFLYLDIISWLESKIENKPVGEIIQNKYLAKYAP
jgi:glutaredoxin-related protein